MSARYARSPVSARERQAGISRLNGLQEHYVSACQQIPGVEPDSRVMEQLTSSILFVDLERCCRQKDTCRVLMQFLSGGCVRMRVVGLVLDGSRAKAPASNTSAAAKVARAVAKLLSTSQALRECVLTGLELPPSELKALCSGLRANKSGIKVLRVVGTLIPEAVCDELFEAAATSSATRLQFKRCGLGPHAVGGLLRIIKAHGCRRDEAVWSATLRGGNVADDRCIRASGVQLLDVSDNPAVWSDEHGLARLAAALETDTWVLGLSLTLDSAKPSSSALHSLQRLATLNRSLLAVVVDGTSMQAFASRHMSAAAVESSVVDELTEWRGACAQPADGHAPSTHRPIRKGSASPCVPSMLSRVTSRSGIGDGVKASYPPRTFSTDPALTPLLTALTTKVENLTTQVAHLEGMILERRRDSGGISEDKPRAEEELMLEISVQVQRRLRRMWAM